MPEISQPLAAAYIVGEADVAIVLDETLPQQPALLEVSGGHARLVLGSPQGASIELHRPGEQTLEQLRGLKDAVVLAAGVEFVVPVRAA